MRSTALIVASTFLLLTPLGALSGSSLLQHRQHISTAYNFEEEPWTTEVRVAASERQQPHWAKAALMQAARGSDEEQKLAAVAGSDHDRVSEHQEAEGLARSLSIWPQPHTVKCDGEDMQTFVGPEHASLIFSPELSTFETSLRETISDFLPDIFVDSYLRTAHGARLVPQEGAKPVGTSGPRIVLNITNTAAKVDFGIDESYDLLLQDSTWTINAATQVGAMYALETLRQIVRPDTHKSLRYFAPKHCRVSDRPRFPHRGLLLDLGRHFEFPVFITRDLLPAMRMNKLNVLHLHLTEDQSFPIESETFPELSEQGAFSSMEVYSKSTMRALVEEAERYGVRVVPEFDMPGHSNSWRRSHPELFACTSAESTRGALDPTKEEVYSFIKKVFDEYRTHVFKDSFLHVGADEVPTKCWARTGHNPNELFNTFINRVGQEVLQAGQAPVVWDEALFTPGVKPPKGAVIQLWRGWDPSVSVQHTVKQGYRALFSMDMAGASNGGGNWYLDQPFRWDHASSGMYLAEPMPEGLTAEEQAMVLGGEGAMWGETVDGSELIQTIFPRLSAVAERLWSPRETRSIELATPRLRKFRCLMLQAGIGAQPLEGALREAPAGPGSCFATAVKQEKQK